MIRPSRWGFGGQVKVTEPARHCQAAPSALPCPSPLPPPRVTELAPVVLNARYDWADDDIMSSIWNRNSRLDDAIGSA